MDWMNGTLIALATLTFLEIVLGVDNIIFISILSGKLPPAQQPLARRLGLLLAMGTRILLLFSLAWIVRLTAPLFALWGHEISGRDLILIVGGIFLLVRAGADRAARHRLFAGLRHHRRRHGRPGVGHGGGRDHLGADHDGRRRADQPAGPPKDRPRAPPGRLCSRA